MALTCARCGAQNPDGNYYCQACGTPLTAAAPPPAPIPGPPPGPPPGLAPPMAAGPGGYMSPYYSPAGIATPVHRTPWMLIIAGVVALVVLMAGCGTALAVFGSRGAQGPTGGGIAELPSPTPFTSPSPVASPTSTPLGSHTESNDGVSVTLPTGWTVADKDSETIVLYDPGPEGEVTLASGAMSPAASAQDTMNEINNELKAKYPDTRSCPNTKTTPGSFNGVNGVSWTVCFTITEGAHSVAAAASMFAGANANGSVYYVAFVLTKQDNLNQYLVIAKPVLASVKWKLS